MAKKTCFLAQCSEFLSEQPITASPKPPFVSIVQVTCVLLKTAYRLAMGSTVRGADYEPSDLFKRAKRYPPASPRSRSHSTTVRRVKSDQLSRASNIIFATNPELLILSLQSLSQEHSKQVPTKPTAGFSYVFDHSYALEEKKNVC